MWQTLTSFILKYLPVKPGAENLQNYFSLIRAHPLRFGLVISGAICLIIGSVSLSLSAWWLYNFQASLSPQISTEVSLPDSVLATDSVEQKLWIDISGAVKQPGIYQVNPGSRVGQVLEQAGGLEASADAEYLAKVMNLAAVVKDGAKVYVPFRHATSASETPEDSGGIGGINLELVNVNTANLDQLDELPGIGQVRAEAIVNNRPYSTLEELVEKKVLTNSVFANIKDLITVY